MTDEDLKVGVLATKVTAMEILPDILARTGEKSVLSSGKGSVYKGNSVQQKWKCCCCGGCSQGCQCGKGGETGCCSTCGHSRDKLSRSTKILVPSQRAVSRTTIFHENILVYWLSNFFVPDYS